MWTRVIPRWNAGISKCTHAIDHARSDDDYIQVRAQHSIKLYSSLRIHHGRHMFAFVQTPRRALDRQYPCTSNTSIHMIPWASPRCLRACFVLFGLRRVRLLCCCAPSKNKPPHGAEQQKSDQLQPPRQLDKLRDVARWSGHSRSGSACGRQVPQLRSGGETSSEVGRDSRLTSGAERRGGSSDET